MESYNGMSFSLSMNRTANSAGDNSDDNVDRKKLLKTLP